MLVKLATGLENNKWITCVCLGQKEGACHQCPGIDNLLHKGGFGCNSRTQGSAQDIPYTGKELAVESLRE